MKFTSISVAAALVATAATVQAKTWLFPIPQQVEWTDHVAPLSHKFKITGAQNKHVKDAAKRYSHLIQEEKWVPVQVAYSNETLTESKHALAGLTISVKNNKVKLDVGVDESYKLEIPASGGQATLDAPTWVGALRGLETFSQLVLSDGSKKGLVAHTVSITDEPAYGHRGVLLDTSRNYYPVEDILRTIDALAYNKMNVFHWHVTDSQSWPLVFKSHPELSERGAYSSHEVYTHSDVQGIIEYAEARGVRIVLELDMPAHTASIVESHPDYMVCTDQFWAKYAAEPPAGQLSLINKDAWKLVQDIVKEGTTIFPDSLYHTGGDEINTDCYALDKDIVEYTEKNNISIKDLWFEWENNLLSYVTNDLKKRPIIWEDSVNDGATYPNNTIIQTWNIPPSNFTSKGYDVIVSDVYYFYLDCGSGGWLGNDPRYISPTQQQTADDTFNYGGTGGSWCAPYKTWQRIYSYDLTYNIPNDSPGKILGGEVALWSEQSGPTVLDSKLWPRTGAAAEIYWSGNYDKDGKRRDLAQVLPRISDWNYRLLARGIDAVPLQPKWCLKHPEQCNLNDPNES